MDLSLQLCVAESSTKVTTLPPVRRLDLGRNLSFSLLPYFFNGLLRSVRRNPFLVTPAKAGVHTPLISVDSGFRRNDDGGGFATVTTGCWGLMYLFHWPGEANCGAGASHVQFLVRVASSTRILARPLLDHSATTRMASMGADASG